MGGMCEKSKYSGAWISALLMVCVYGAAYCNAADLALLLQQSPVNGGTVNPGMGIHHFQSDTEVTLNATPRPGYQFVYWMGDVSDPTSSTVNVRLNSPKIVIAVFERMDNEDDSIAEMTASLGTSDGGGGLYRTAPDYSNQGYTGGGAKNPKKFNFPKFEEPEPVNKDLPVPEPGPVNNDLPVPEQPVPEPATVLLFIFGSVIAAAKRRTAR